MKPSSQSPRTSSKLSDSVHHQLNMYALAASAAGVGMLALAQPAEAKIIYTPSHRYVPFRHHLTIDLNHDGIVDFKVGRYWLVTSGLSLTHLEASGRNGNRIAGFTSVTSVSDSVYQFTTAFRKGLEIGSSRRFNGGWMANRWLPKGQRPYCNGLWNNVKNRYLGLRFEIGGKVHYGWARLNESCDLGVPKGKGAQALLTGYAYETIPNKPIIAGKTHGTDVIVLNPASLGALAAGAPGSHRGK